MKRSQQSIRTAQSRDRSEVIRASEIGEYVYCARAWWLQRVQGVPSRNIDALRSGQALHQQHGQAVATMRRERRVAMVLAILALLAAAAALFLLLEGLL